MSEHELHHQSVSALRDLIAQRTVSSREPLERFVVRVDSVNPAVNAVVTLDVDRARDAADADTAAGRSNGPLHDIPITVKDALAVAGVRAAGAIPFGKTS